MFHSCQLHLLLMNLGLFFWMCSQRLVVSSILDLLVKLPLWACSLYASLIMLQMPQQIIQFQVLSMTQSPYTQSQFTDFEGELHFIFYFFVKNIFHLCNDPFTRSNKQSTPEVFKEHLFVITGNTVMKSITLIRSWCYKLYAYL